MIKYFAGYITVDNPKYTFVIIVSLINMNTSLFKSADLCNINLWLFTIDHTNVSNDRTFIDNLNKILIIM